MQFILWWLNHGSEKYFGRIGSKVKILELGTNKTFKVHLLVIYIYNFNPHPLA